MRWCGRHSEPHNLDVRCHEIRQAIVGDYDAKLPPIYLTLRPNIFLRLCLFCIASAGGAAAAEVETIAFKVRKAFEPGAAVSGELRIPPSSRLRLPAVL